MNFLQPRRFAELWQMSEDWPGTLEQQQAVRDALTPIFGTNVHRLAQKMDRWINRPGSERHFLPIAFVDIAPYLGLGFATGILLSHHLLTAPGIIAGIVRHETGHVYDQLGLLTQEDKFWFMDLVSGHHDGNWRQEYQETWADAFRDWWASDGHAWPELTPILLREPS